MYVRFVSSSINAIFLYPESSEASQSEIHAPVPRRHRLLQQTESPTWMYTPSISPGSSRPVSPTAAFSRHPQLSFSALSEKPLSEKRIFDEQWGWARKWVRWMHRGRMRGWVIPVSIVGVAWIKWLVGLGGYSGLSCCQLGG